nr:tyrosine--tRNA ligase 1, cytoplasmic-like [Tanacetum cinerariifolium]
MLQMKEDETIDAFTTKLTTLVNKAASLGHTMEDETLVRKLLNDVPDSSESLDGAITESMNQPGIKEDIQCKNSKLEGGNNQKYDLPGLKEDHNNKDEYKARLVAKGYLQQPGNDYFETFSPVTKPSTMRIVLCLALSKNWNYDSWMSTMHFFMRMDVDEKLRKLKTICEECIQEEELKDLLMKNPEPVCFDEFEPFRRMHIDQGIMKTININKLTCWLQSKDMDNILSSYGLQRRLIQDHVSTRNSDGFFLSKQAACGKGEMGQSEQSDLATDKIFYACMRCADIVFTKADICQLGMDQRNVGVITREFWDDNKPIILLHQKMSKSDASSAIFMDDNEDVVNLKIKKAFCSPNIVEGNPCLEYIKHIVFPCFKEFKVERKAKKRGEKVFRTFKEVITKYKEGDLHPGDLKPTLSKALNRILQPVVIISKMTRRLINYRWRLKVLESQDDEIFAFA